MNRVGEWSIRCVCWGLTKLRQFGSIPSRDDQNHFGIHSCHAWGRMDDSYGYDSVWRSISPPLDPRDRAARTLLGRQMHKQDDQKGEMRADLRAKAMLVMQQYVVLQRTLLNPLAEKLKCPFPDTCTESLPHASSSGWRRASNSLRKTLLTLSLLHRAFTAVSLAQARRYNSVLLQWSYSSQVSDMSGTGRKN